MIPFQHGVFATAAGAVAGFESIATVTATGGETSLTFSSIPQGYASLQIRGIALSSSNNVVQMQCNSDSGANYTIHELLGTGSTVVANGSTAQTYLQASQSIGTSATYPSVMIIDMHDYASTTRNKTMRSFAALDKDTSSRINLNSGLWLSTSAVSAIKLLLASGSFSAGTTFALYGIKAAA